MADDGNTWYPDLGEMGELEVQQDFDFSQFDLDLDPQLLTDVIQNEQQQNRQADGQENGRHDWKDWAETYAQDYAQDYRGAFAPNDGPLSFTAEQRTDVRETDQNNDWVGAFEPQVPRMDQFERRIYEFIDDGNQLYHPAVGYYWQAPTPSPGDGRSAIFSPYAGPSEHAPAFAVQSGRGKRKRSEIPPVVAPKDSKTAKPRKKSSGPAFECSCATSPAIPRPWNPWFCFRKENWSAFSKRNPGLSAPEMTRLLSKSWNEMPEQQKARYTQMAEEQKRKHEEKYPNYKYDPSKKKRKKYGIEGSCKCGAFEKNNLYKSLRKEGQEPIAAYDHVLQQFGGAPVIATPGPSHPIHRQRQNPRLAAGLTQLNYSYVDGEESKIARQLKAS